MELGKEALKKNKKMMAFYLKINPRWCEEEFFLHIHASST